MSSMWGLRKLARKWLGNEAARKKAPRGTKPRRPVRLALEHLENRLAPATDIWTGAHVGTDGLYHWSDAANWSAGVPVQGEDLSFPDVYNGLAVPAASKTNVNDLSLGGGNIFNSLNFSGTGYNLSGNGIILNTVASSESVTSTQGGSLDTIAFNIQLGNAPNSNQFFDIGGSTTSGATLVITGQLSSPAGVQSATLAKDGAGTLVLAADNSAFNGAVTIETGALQITNAKGLGTGVATVEAGSQAGGQGGGQLQLAGGIGPVTNNLKLNGSGPTGTGALTADYVAGTTSVITGSDTITGNIELDSDAAVGASAQFLTANGAVTTYNPNVLVLNGVISDTGSGHNLSKEGFGQVILDPLGSPNGNLYHGNTTVDAGTLTIRHSLALGQGPGGGAAATVTVNSTPQQSGTLQLEFIPAGPGRNYQDSNVNSTNDGFTVRNELLVLNGPGFEGIDVYPRTGATAPLTTTSGALNNKAGNNSWTQNVTLWSGNSGLATDYNPLYWNYPTIGIGAEANTTLTLNGVVSDNTGGSPNYALIKTRPGRVVLTNSDTFIGRTEILDGALNIRDSQALGQATGQNQVYVFPGASLELQADSKADSIPLAGGGQTTDLRIGNFINLTLLGHGLNNLGALRNIDGTNQWNGPIHLQSFISRANPGMGFSSNGAAIGVDADPGPFDANAVPLTPLGYSQLTVNGVIDGPPNAYLFKVGLPGPMLANGTQDSGGELVLTNANTYLGVTDIQQGWITARNNQALGGTIPDLSDLLQPGTIVENGASLVLKTDIGTNPNNPQTPQNLALYENLYLSGDGIHHRLGNPDANGNQNYSWLNQDGALLNLEGTNTVGGVDIDPTSPLFHSTAGDIALNGQAGIGAELDGLPSSNPPASQLTLMGKITEATPGWVNAAMPVHAGSGIDKLGSQRVILQGPGTYTGNDDVKAGVLRVQNDTALGIGATGKTTVENGAALELQASAAIETGGLSSGIQVTTEGLVLKGPGNTTAPNFFTGSAGTLTPTLENLSDDNLWRGPVTLEEVTAGGNAVDPNVSVENDSRLTIYGAIGDDTTSTTGAGFAKLGTGKLVLAGNNSYRGMTNITAGTVNLQNGAALGAPSTPTIQTFTTPGTSGTFTLGFTDSTNTTNTTNPISNGATASTVMAALNGLPNLSGEGGLVTVIQSFNQNTNTYTYTVSFGGNLTGFNQKPLTVTPGGGSSTNATITTPGNGGVITSGTAGIELQGDITVAGKSLETQGTGSPSATDLTGVATWFPQGPAAVTNGQTTGNQNVAGRLTGVAVDPTDPNVIYVATAGGGSWKTTDGGQTWQPLNDASLDTSLNPLSAQDAFGGTLAVAPTDPHVIYFATGESNNGPDSFYGQGIYMSQDSGRTWTLLQGNAGKNEFVGATISKLVVDPANAFTVYAAVNFNGVNGAAPGSATTGNAGIWYSTNTNAASPTWTNLTLGYQPADQTKPMINTFGGNDQYTDLDVMADVRGNLGEGDQYAPGTRFLIMAIGSPDGGYAEGDPATKTYPGNNAVYIGVLQPGQNPLWYIDSFPTADTNITITLLPSNTPTGLPGQATSINPVTVSANGVIKTGASPSPQKVYVDGSDVQFNLYAAVTYPTDYPMPNEASPTTLDPLKGTFRAIYTTNIHWDPTQNKWILNPWSDTNTPTGAALAQPGTPQGSAAPTNAGGGTDLEGPLNRGNGEYASVIAVDPNNPLRVFVAGVGQPYTSGPWMSTDGGQTWTDLGLATAAPHVNYHGMTFDNQGRLLVATDGGVWRLDSTSPIQWTDLNGNLADLQFNSVADNPSDPFQLFGGTEDNGQLSYNGDGGNLAWTQTDGNNGGPVVVDINNPQNVFHVKDGVLEKSTNGGQTWNPVFTVETVPGINGTALPAAQPSYFPYLYYYPTFDSYLFNTEQPWNQNYQNPANLVTNNIQVPLAIDTVNTQRVLVAGPPSGTPNPTGHYATAPWESVQGGAPGTFVSLDPTNSIRGALLGFGLAVDQGPFVADSRFPLVTDQGANAYVPDTIYALTSNGVYVTKDHGKHWVLSNSGLNTTDLSAIAVDPNNRDVAYVTRNSPTGGGPHLYMTTNAGQSWTAIDNSTLPDLPAWTVTVDPKTEEVFVGNDHGVWAATNTITAGSPISPNANATWQHFGIGMPNTQVKSLVLDPNLDRLTAGTYGRSTFEIFLDDSLANGGAIHVVSGSSVWTGPVTLAGNTVLRTEKDASVKFVGPISNDNASDNWYITKVGPGTVVLAGVNSYGGANSSLTPNGQPIDTDIQQGVLIVQNPEALGSAASGTIVETGATLELQSDLAQEPVYLYGDGVPVNGHNQGALFNASNSNTYTGTLTLETSATIGVNSGSTLTVGISPSLLGTGTITDGDNNYNLTKELTGTLILNTANSYGGKTEIYQGAVQVENGQALGASGTAANGTDVYDGAQLQLQTPSIGPLAGQPVVVSGENLTLSGTGINNTGALLDTGGNNTWAGPITFAARPGFAPQTSPAGVVAFGVTNAGDVLTVAPPAGIQEEEPTGLSKVGAGTLVLATANSYSGTTYVNSGILTIQDPGALGTPNTDEEQRITVGGNGLGSFQVNFEGQVTSPAIPYGATATQVQTALNNLSTIAAAGGVTVTSPAQSPVTLPDGSKVYVYTVAFKTAGVNQPQMIATGINGASAAASTVADGGIGTQVNSGSTLALDLDPTNAGKSSTVTGETLDLNGVGVARPAPITGNAQDTNLGALDNLSGNNTWNAAVILDTTRSQDTPPLATAPQVDAVGVDGGSLTVSGTVEDRPVSAVNPVAPFTPATLEKVGAGTASNPATDKDNNGQPGTLAFTSINTYQGNTQVLGGVLRIAAGTDTVSTDATYGDSSLGAPVSSETETLTVFGTTGQYTLQFGNSTTGQLAYNSTAAQIAAALNALPSIQNAGGSVNVVQTQTGNPNVYTITFNGALAGRDLDPAPATPALTATPSGGAATTVVTTTQGGLGGTSVLGTGTLQLAGGITVNGPNTLVLSSGNTFTGEPLTLSGNGASYATPPAGDGTPYLAALDAAANSSDTWDNPVTLVGPASVGAQANAVLTIDQPVGQAQALTPLTEYDQGTVVLSGTASNTYTGTTFIADGEMQLDKTGGAVAIRGSSVIVGDNQPTPVVSGSDVLQLRGSNQINPLATVTVNGDGLFDLYGFAQTLAAVNITDGEVTTGTQSGQAGQLAVNNLSVTGGTVSLANTGSSLTLLGTASPSVPDLAAASDSNANALISGKGNLVLGSSATYQFQVTHPAGGGFVPDLQVSAPISGNGGLHKTGNGVLELTAANTYSGATTVSAGSLFVDGTSAAIGAAQLDGGLLGGTGTVGAITTTTTPGSVLAPGAVPGGVPGILNVNGNVTLDPQTTFQVALLGNNPGNGAGSYSQLAVQGSVSLGGATVAGSAFTSPTPPSYTQQFTVVQVSGANNALTDTFATPTEFLSGLKFENLYNQNGGQNAVLQRIPANVITTLGVQYADPDGVPGDASVTFTAQVTPEPGATYPPGGATGDTVDFIDMIGGKTTTLGSGTVNSSGVATLTIPVAKTGQSNPPLDAAGIGLHTVYAHFEGDQNFNAGNSSNGGDSAPVSFGGLDVTGVTPNTSQAVLSASGGLTQVVVTFSQPVGSFPLSQVTLTDPSGNPVPLAGATLAANAGSNNTVWTLTLPAASAQKTPGVYTITVGPDVTDGSGFPMDQNHNGLYGESADQFTDLAVVDGLAVTNLSPPPGVPVQDDTGLSQIQLTFNMAVDANNNQSGVTYEGFGANSLTLTEPNGTVVPLIDNNAQPNAAFGVSLSYNAADTVWTVSFNKQTALGAYTVSVGPNVYDRAGDEMNQDYTSGDTALFQTGAPAADGFQGTITIAGMKVQSLAPANPTVTPDNPGLSSATVTFNEPVAANGFPASQVQLTDPNGNPVSLAGATVAPVSGTNDTQWTITFPTPLQTPGDYILTINPGVTDAVGNALDQDQDGTTGQSDDVFNGYLVVDGLKVIGLAPTVPVLNGPGLSSATVTFNEPVASFPVSQVVLDNPQGNGVSLAGATVTPVSGTNNEVWVINFPAQHAPGKYTLRIGPDVYDNAGYPMNQNGNTTAGESGMPPAGDQFVGTLLVAGLKVTGIAPTTPVLDDSGLGSATISFNEPVSSFPVSDVTLAAPGGASVSLAGASLTAVAGTNSTVWVLSGFAVQKALGNYTLTVGPNVTDAYGSKLDQNQNGTAGESSDVFNGPLTVAGLSVVAAFPTGAVPSDPGLSSFTLSFNEPLAAAGLNGYVQVNGPNGPVSGVSVSGSGATWQVNFPAQSALGTYVLSLSPAVRDAAGNMLDQNGNLVGGEASDAFSLAAQVVPTPYVGLVTPAQASVLFQPPVPVTSHHHRVPGRFTEVITLFNTGQQPIQGPFSLVLLGLPMKKVHRHFVSTVHVLNAAGIGSVLFPGAPFVTDIFSAGQLSSFQGASFVIQFQTSGPSPTFTPIILAGLIP